MFAILTANIRREILLWTIEKIMKKYGKYKVYMQQYRRFKADNARDVKSDSTIEYLHCLIKDI